MPTTLGNKPPRTYRDGWREAGRRVREMREKKGQTGMALAKALGVSDSTYRNLERGTFRMSMVNVYLLAKHFNVQMEYIAEPIVEQDINDGK